MFKYLIFFPKYNGKSLKNFKQKSNLTHAFSCCFKRSFWNMIYELDRDKNGSKRPKVGFCGGLGREVGEMEQCRSHY